MFVILYIDVSNVKFSPEKFAYLNYFELDLAAVAIRILLFIVDKMWFVRRTEEWAEQKKCICNFFASNVANDP